MTEMALNFLPTSLHHSVTKTFFEGYCMSFSAIVHVLQRPATDLDSIPFPSTVIESMVPPHDATLRLHEGYFTSCAIEQFFSKGGLPDFAIDYILDFTQMQSPLGDGIWDAEMEASCEDDESIEYPRLPKCPNDINFRLVRERLGLSPTANGPHR
jgi:hypothetical protein